MSTAKSVLAIDPGSEQSAWVLYNPEGRRVVDCGITENQVLLTLLEGIHFAADDLALEMVACYGMAVGASIFETVRWIGIFQHAWGEDNTTLVYRREVKLHLLGRANGTDAAIHAALVHQIGPKGTKKAPGPTFGCKKDIWAALGVAVTYSDTKVLKAQLEYVHAAQRQEVVGPSWCVADGCDELAEIGSYLCGAHRRPEFGESVYPTVCSAPNCDQKGDAGMGRCSDHWAEFST